MGYDTSEMGYGMPEQVLPRIRPMLLARTDLSARKAALDRK